MGSFEIRFTQDFILFYIIYIISYIYYQLSFHFGKKGFEEKCKKHLTEPKREVDLLLFNESFACTGRRRKRLRIVVGDQH